MTTNTAVEEDEFATGGQAAKEDLKEEKAARAAARGGAEYLHSLLAKDGDIAYIRFLWDEPQFLRTKFHSTVKTKDAPADKPTDYEWFPNRSAVCRFTLKANKAPFYDNCYVCEDPSLKDNKGKNPYAGLRLWAPAIVRQPILGTQEMVGVEGGIQQFQVGQIVGFADEMVKYRDLDKQGNPVGDEKLKPRVVIVRQAVENFFDPILAQAKLTGTILNVDWAVMRTGEKRDTSYQVLAQPPVPAKVRDENGVETGEVKTFDLRDPAFARAYAEFLPDIRGTVKWQMSDRYYGLYFDRRVSVPFKREDDDSAAPANPAQSTTTQTAPAATFGIPGAPASTGTPAAAPAGGGGNEDVAAKLAAMRGKVMGNNPQPSAQPEADPQPDTNTPAADGQQQGSMVAG